MIGTFVNGILIFMVFIVCILASYTDIKEGKIYNKHIIIFLTIGIIVQLVYLIIMNKALVNLYIVNLSSTIIFSVLIYFFRIWSAGDAKLVITIIALMPMEIYNVNFKNVFPGFLTIIIIFLCGFFYLVIESVFLYVKDIYNGKNKKNIKVNITKKVILKILYAWIISINLNCILSYYFKAFYLNNLGLCMIFNALLVLYLAKFSSNKKLLISVIFLGSLIYIISNICLGKSNIHFNIRLLLLIVVMILARILCGRYNYKRIYVENLRVGMVLSSSMVVNFLNSKIKGLPLDASENMKSRLTLDQIESIKRWRKSKKGMDYVVVLRQLHFAPFIFLGTVISMIIKLLGDFL